MIWLSSCKALPSHKYQRWFKCCQELDLWHCSKSCLCTTLTVGQQKSGTMQKSSPLEFSFQSSRGRLRMSEQCAMKANANANISDLAGIHCLVADQICSCDVGMTCFGCFRWHLSYFGDSHFIRNKVKSFSHQDCNVDSMEEIQKCAQSMLKIDDYVICTPHNSTMYLPTSTHLVDKLASKLAKVSKTIWSKTRRTRIP